MNFRDPSGLWVDDGAPGYMKRALGESQSDGCKQEESKEETCKNKNEYDFEEPLKNHKDKMNKKFDNEHYTLMDNNGKAVSLLKINGKYTTGSVGTLTAPHASYKGNLLKGRIDAKAGIGWNTFTAGTQPLTFSLLGHKITAGAKAHAGGLSFECSLKVGKNGFKFKLGGSAIVGGGFYIDAK